MQKVEITVTPDYVADWTIGNAIRELLQNAIDAQTQGHAMHVNYNAATETLTIQSVGAKLSIDSLLLGSTTKAGDNNSIGQFGEGYKIATLVLLRNNKPIIFYNGVAKETWNPRFIKSRRFGCPILGFFIDKWSLFAPVNDVLTITINNITQEEYDTQIVPEALFLSNDWHIVESTSLGHIIDKPGAVYINGLFVCNHSPYKYGYNFEPGALRLDRDRKLASDFDLEWLASKMWAQVTDSDKLIELIELGTADVRYIAYHAGNHTTVLADKAWDSFIAKYGKNAVPVTIAIELDEISAAYRPIIVGSDYYDILIKSSKYHKPELCSPKLTLCERFKQWYDDNELDDYINSDAKNEFIMLINELRVLE